MGRQATAPVVSPVVSPVVGSAVTPHERWRGPASAVMLEDAITCDRREGHLW